MNISQTFEKHPQKIFWITCLLLGTVQYFFGLQHFYYDAERYWESGRELVTNGKFSLYNHITPRGVLFPLLNYGIITLLGFLGWHEITVFKYLNTVFVCWGLWSIVPSIYKKATGNEWTVLQKLTLVLIVHFFWFRYISCPLSDFLCLFLVLFGFHALWEKNVSLYKIVLAGLICGFVFNTRPIYNLLLLIYPVFLWVVAYEKPWKKLVYTSVLVGAAVVISIPQLLINKKNWGAEHTIFQPTDAYYQKQSLYLGQLRWGLYIQKYDTYVGDPRSYRCAPVYYFQNKAQRVAEMTEAQQILSYSDYLHYLKKHPLKILRFSKNLFNGTDLAYNTPYIYDITHSLAFSILNYCMWFIGIVSLLLLADFRKLNKAVYWIIGYLAVTCLLCIPIAIEPRFLIALYLLMYVTVVMHSRRLFDYVKGLPRSGKIVFGLIVIVYLWVSLYLSDQTFREIEYDVIPLT